VGQGGLPWVRDGLGIAASSSCLAQHLRYSDRKCRLTPGTPRICGLVGNGNLKQIPHLTRKRGRRGGEGRPCKTAQGAVHMTYPSLATAETFCCLESPYWTLTSKGCLRTCQHHPT
jgi:hypothetical protein